ncbi:MAG TPA: hypothetical protein VJH92_06205 [Candidatus Nanoarchaeia archaeon]|nr:hypothetical protein [Candidatus Nanoarchaeia archaeon]
MKKRVYALFAVFFVIALIGLASSINYQKAAIDQCRKDCRLNKTLDKEECVSELRICKEECGGFLCKRICVNDAKLCIKEANNDYKSCKNYCSSGMIDFSINQTYCENSGGLFSPLCNGPYFGLMCGRESFCLCEGKNNYTCPEDYSCKTNFLFSNKKAGVYGWFTTRGLELGNVGLCAKNPFYEPPQNDTEQNFTG